MKLTTIKMAVTFVLKQFPDKDIETAGEIEDFYIFSFRPKGTDFGFVTGTTVYLVNKKSGTIMLKSITDPIINKAKYIKLYNPITLKEL